MQLKRLLIGFLIIGIMACNKTVTTIPEIPVAPVVDNTTVTKITNADINTWIHQNMSAYYLWPDKMPALAKTNTSSNPMDFKLPMILLINSSSSGPNAAHKPESSSLDFA